MENCIVLEFGKFFDPCGPSFDRRTTEAAHMKAKRRFGDQYAAPVCPKHHDEQHQIGIESWSYKYFEGPKRAEEIALAHYARYQGDFTALEDIK
jgi:hypothetical protein